MTSVRILDNYYCLVVSRLSVSHFIKGQVRADWRSADGHLTANRETARSQPSASSGTTEIPQNGRLTADPGTTVGVILVFTVNGLANSVNERLFLKILVSPDNLLLNLIKVNLILL